MSEDSGQWDSETVDSRRSLSTAHPSVCEFILITQIACAFAAFAL